MKQYSIKKDLHEGQLEPVARGTDNVPDTFHIRGINFRVARAVEGAFSHVEVSTTSWKKRETVSARAKVKCKAHKIKEEEHQRSCSQHLFHTHTKTHDI